MVKIEVIGEKEKKQVAKSVPEPMSKAVLALSVLLGIIVVALLVWLGMFLVNSGKQHSRRSERVKNLSCVGDGLRRYGEAYRRLPVAVRLDGSGRPIASWRFDTIKMMEDSNGPNYPNKRWDDPAHDSWYKSAPEFFCWTSDEDPAKQRQTNVMAITGPGTAFDGQKRMRRLDLDDDTIVAVEVTGSGVHWMQPGDLTIDKVSASLAKGLEGDGFCVLFADGTVWFLSSEVPIGDVKKFMTIDESRKYDRDEVLGPHKVLEQSPSRF